MEKGKTGWIQTLNKQQIIAELRKRNIQGKESEKFDDLRERLRSAVKGKQDSRLTSENKTSDRTNRDTETESEGENFSSEESDKDSTMSSDSGKLQFSLEKDDWETFTEQLEFYIIEKDIKDDRKKVSTLMTRVDQETFKLIKQIVAPENIIDKKFEEIVKVMNNHFNPKPSVAMERCKFHQAKQEENESIAEYAAKLKKLSIHCNFTDLKTALHDQLVCGIRDKDIRVKLFKDDTLDYDKALHTAITHEAAVKNAAASMNALEHKQYGSEVYAIRREQGRWTRGGGGSRSNRRQGTDQNGATHGTTQQQAASSTQRSGDEKRHVVCYCCAKVGHTNKDCRFRGYTCNFCDKKGHLEKACRKKGTDAQHPKDEVKMMTSTEEDIDGAATESSHQEDFFSLNISVNEGMNGRNVSMDENKTRIDIKNKYCENENNNIDIKEIGDINKYTNPDRSKAEPMFVNITVNGKEMNLEIDTGTFATVFSERIYKENFGNFKLTKTNLNLKAYDGKSLEPIGKMSNLHVKFNNMTRILECFVLPGSGPGLIGRQWLKQFDSWPLIVPGICRYEIKKLDVDKLPNYFADKFKELFSDTPGCYNKSKTKIHLRSDARPIALKCRHVAHALRPLIEREIERLVNLGHLEQVEVSEWATPIVPVFKSNGNIRICGDFKTTVNPFIIIDKYPLHTIDDIFAKLQGGISFSELDLTHAYMQFPVDESCTNLLTIVTHKGLFKYKKIPEGVSPAPADVQRKMDECLRGINGVIA